MDAGGTIRKTAPQQEREAPRERVEESKGEQPFRKVQIQKKTLCMLNKKNSFNQLTKQEQKIIQNQDENDDVERFKMIQQVRDTSQIEIQTD